MSSYLQDCHAWGVVDCLEDIQQHYRKITRRYAWKIFKVMEEDDYEYTSKSNFAKYMCKTLNRDYEKMETKDWWDGVKGVFMKAMQDMRSATTQSMKRSFIDYEIRQDKRMPEMNCFEVLRQDYESYSLFMELFVSCIVTRDTFKRRSVHQKISEFVSVADEAMAMLVLKNNYNVWTEMTAHIKSGNKKISLEGCVVTQKFMEEGKGRGRSWTNEGKMYYNEMFKAITVDRQMKGGMFDDRFLEMIRERKRKTLIKEVKPEIANIKVACITDLSFGWKANDSESEQDEDVDTIIKKKASI
jgi:hypothetical protein